MPALVSYWEGAILHFPLNQYSVMLRLELEKRFHAGQRHLHIGMIAQDVGNRDNRLKRQGNRSLNPQG